MSRPGCVHVAGTQYIGREASKLLVTESVQHLCPRLGLQHRGGQCEQHESEADVFQQQQPIGTIQQLCLYQGCSARASESGVSTCRSPQVACSKPWLITDIWGPLPRVCLVPV